MSDNVLPEARAALEGLDLERFLASYAETFQFNDAVFKQHITDREELKEYFQLHDLPIL